MKLVVLGVLGVLADLVSVNRKLLENVQFRLRRLDLVLPVGPFVARDEADPKRSTGGCRDARDEAQAPGGRGSST
jgi:hypothetical protein